MSLENLLTFLPAATAAGGALLLPRIFRGSANPAPQATPLAAQLPWLQIEGDEKTVQTTTGGFFRCVALRGALLSAASEQVRRDVLQRRQHWLLDRRLKPCGIRFLSRRRRIAMTPPGFPLNRHFAEADVKWNDMLSRGFQMRHYLMLSVNSASEIPYLDDAFDNFASMFSDEYGPTILSNLPDANGYSPLATFLASLVNGNAEQVTPIRHGENLADALAASHLVPFEDGTFAWNGIGGTTYVAPVCVKRYPETTSDMITQALLTANAELDLMVHYEPRTTAKADSTLRWRAKQAKFRVDNQSIAKEFSDALEEIGAEKNAYGTADLVVLVRGATRDELDAGIDELLKNAGARSTTAVRERSLAPRAFWSVLPGYEFFARPRSLSAANIADLTPLEGAPTGNTVSIWGRGPLRYFPTATLRTPYALNLHPTTGDDMSPHAGLFAPTGRGKSVFMSFLLSGALTAHQELRVVAFDRNRGLEVPTLLLDGQYLYPGRADLPLNPFDCADTPRNRKRLEQLLALLAEVDDDDSIENIGHTVADMMGYPRNIRNLRRLFSTVVGAKTQLESGLKKWVASDRYGNLFNGKYDAFDPTARRMTTIAMDEVITDARLSGALTGYMITRIQGEFADTGTPYLLAVDECNILLQDRGLCNLIAPELLTARKNHGAIVMAFQTVDGLLETPIAETIIKQCDTFFFWPGTAQTDEECKRFNLTTAEKNFVLGRERPRGAARPVLVKRKEGESVFIDADLSALGQHLRMFRGNATLSKRLLQCQTTHGADWATAYLNLPDSVDLGADAAA